MLIEFFSLPGAGKTTLVNAVAAGTDLITRPKLAAAWRRQSLLQRSRHSARALLHAPTLMAAARLAVGVPLSSGESLSRLVRLIAKRHWVRSQAGVMLIDQGFLQELWSILYAAGHFEPDPADLSPLIRSIYAGMQVRVVFIDVDARTASTRISGRDYGNSRLDRLPEADIRGQLARTRRLPRAILDAATAAGLQVEILDGSAPVAELVDRLQPVLPPVTHAAGLAA
jgi:hypothetical protein